MLSPQVPFKSTYRLTEAFRHISLPEVREIVDEQLLKFCFLGTENDELFYSIQQLKRTKNFFPETLGIQLNVDLLFKKTIFTTCSKGMIKRIVNKVEISDNWLLLKNQLKTKYKSDAIELFTTGIDSLLKEPNRLEQLFINSKYSFLVIDPFSITSQEEFVIGKKQIDHFLEQHSLPLITTCSFSSSLGETYAHKLQTVGILDTDNFNHKSFAKWLKRKVDIYDLKVKVVADFEQCYILDRYQKVTYAEQFLSVEVAGCYSQTRARTLEVLA